MPLRLVFFGTPAFAVPSLRALAASAHPIVTVVTQPDRPRGRGQRVSPPPVKAAADELGYLVEQPASLRDDGFTARMRSLSPDLGVVAAYGRILSADLLAVPRLGMINVHASLLPRWRGAAPVHRAILAGDAVTGISIMRVVRALDAGPTLMKLSTPIGANETSAELEARLARMGADLIARVVDDLERGSVEETAQDPSLVTYAARVERADSVVDFSRTALELHNQIRGLQPWPLASAVLNGNRIRLLASAVVDSDSEASPASAQPGTVVRVEPEAVVLATGSGLLRILRVQLEARAPVSVRDFLNGHSVRPGDRFGQA